MKDSIDIQLYETASNNCPYLQWKSRLSKKARAIITARLARIRIGNLGDSKPIKGIVSILEKKETRLYCFF